MQGEAVSPTKVDYVELLRKEYAQRLIVPAPLDANGFPAGRAALQETPDAR